MDSSEVTSQPSQSSEVKSEKVKSGIDKCIE
jgi:hypothetical protein